MTKRVATFLTLAVLTVMLTVPAGAAGKWVVRGKGFGHGVGASQYGMLGLAKEGRRYKRILKHYYTGVSIGQADTRRVRVLITTGLGSVPFTDARRACGKRLNPDRSYRFTPKGSSKTILRRANGRRLTGCGKQGAAKGGTVTFKGFGRYRGALVGRNVGGAMYAINRVGIEDYIQGVIPNEVPASWHKQALRAQAVAARSYALATRVNGDGYDLYDDTRSQVYNGRSSEHKRTNRATRRTAGEVIKSGGGVATAFFFSTSGGETEHNKFVWGGDQRSYLKSVNDPFDDVSPVHRWKVRFSNSTMRSKLSGLFSGRLKRIRVLKTGRSPRIVRAKVVGSRGSSRVSGDTLRFRLGLRSTWAKFVKR